MCRSAWQPLDNICTLQSCLRYGLAGVVQNLEFSRFWCPELVIGAVGVDTQNKRVDVRDLVSQVQIQSGRLSVGKGDLYRRLLSVRID